MPSDIHVKTYRLVPQVQLRPTERFGVLGIDRWNQSADPGSMFTLRSAMTGADRNDADPAVLLYIPDSR